MSLSVKRILAFLIDYCVIVGYAVVLFGGVMLFQTIRQVEVPQLSPLLGQFVGFVSLTLPVVLYFFFSERGKHQGTLGKRALKIRVEGNNLLLRSLLKFVPWELAHAGVLWLFYFENAGLKTPVWVWVLLITPQVMVLIYFGSLFVFQGKQTVYDKIAHTQVRDVMG